MNATPIDGDAAAQCASLGRSLFHPFPLAPPAAAAALAKAYEALSGYATHGRFCEQCFTPEQERMVLRCNDLRNKPPEEFSLIYYEHPDCSVGADGFMYFLPRALEALVLDSSVGEEVIASAVKCGIYALPEVPQSALRDLFARAAIGWFKEQDPAPFGPSNSEAEKACPRPWRLAEEHYSDATILPLLHLRVSPREVFSWLRDLNTPLAWRYLCKLLTREYLLEPEVYYVVADGHAQHHADMASVLNRIARTHFFEVITRDALTAAWETVGMEDQKHYDMFRTADGYYDGCAYRPSVAEQLADLRTLEDLAIELLE